MKAVALAVVVSFAVQQPPVFRSAVDIVEVDVVVHDRTGAFVADLSVDDFELQDNGDPQRVDQLYLHVASASPGKDATPPQSWVPSSAQAGSRRTFVVVFDSGQMTSGGFKRTQDAALALFDKRFVNGADFGGVVVDGRMINNRLTSDREELIRAVKAAKPGSKKNARLLEEREFPRMSAIEAVRIRVSNDANVRAMVIRRAKEDDPNARIEMIEAAVDGKATDLSTAAQAASNETIQAVLGLMKGLSRLDGRKSVVLMSEGFLADQSWPLVQEAVGAAARANARIYALDARGLNRGLRSVFDVQTGGSDAGARLLEPMDLGGDAMNSLAVDTGAFVVRNTNDFAGAIERIADDASHYYVLGYRPSTPQDGKLHAITVRVKRPGIAARARRGYVAAPRPVPATADASEPAARTLTLRRAQAARAEIEGAPIETARPEPFDAAQGRPVEGRATGAAPSSGYRVRPDAVRHIDMLLKDQNSDDAARAGWEAYQRGDVATARTSLMRAAVGPSAEPWVHYALGMADYALREYRDAAGEWEKVREAAPDFEPVYFDLVDSYLQLKEHDQAVRVLRGARERWARDPEVFNAFGVVQTIRGALDDAVRSFQDAVAAAPGEPTSYFNLGRALEMRYYRSRRYVQQLRSWVSNEHDRTGAIENYRKYLEFGGPFAKDAQEGLARLSWIPKP